MVFLLSAFAAFFVVQLLKFLILPKLTGQGVWKAVIKMVLAGGVAFGTALLWLPEWSWRPAVVYGLAGAGLAMVIHKSTRLISHIGDDVLTKFLDKMR